MKIYNAKNSKIIVLSNNGQYCPRIKIAGSTTLIRDDYHGEVKSRMLKLSAYLLWGDAMKIYNAKNSKIIVLTTHNGGSCPRIKITRSTTLLRDDYHGEVKSQLLNLSAYLF